MFIPPLLTLLNSGNNKTGQALYKCHFPKSI